MLDYKDHIMEYKDHILVQLPWLKRIMNKNREFKIDFVDISDYFGIDISGKSPETIYKIFNDILLKEGIKVSVDKYNDRYDRLIFSNPNYSFENHYSFENQNISKPRYTKKKEYNKLNVENQEFTIVLKNNKLCEEESKLLLCPYCYHYSVDFSRSYSWYCNDCNEAIDYSKYILDLNDQDKYHIYKLYGIEALSLLINEPLRRTKRFVASYFKKGCMTRKEKCLYFDFLNSED